MYPHRNIHNACTLPLALPSFTCGKLQSCPPTSQCPDVTREEIANACGVDDLHDGINYTRTACVIAVARSQEMFEPLLHQVGGKGGGGGNEGLGLKRKGCVGPL